MEDGLVLVSNVANNVVKDVLILVVMEDGLVLQWDLLTDDIATCLNPCCNGRWSRTLSRILTIGRTRES